MYKAPLTPLLYYVQYSTLEKKLRWCERERLVNFSIYIFKLEPNILGNLSHILKVNMLRVQVVLLRSTARSIEIVPKGGPPFWLMKSLFGWWILVGDSILGGCMLMNSTGRLHFWDRMLINSRGGSPHLERGPPLGTISMDLAVYHTAH